MKIWPFKHNKPKAETTLSSPAVWLREWLGGGETTVAGVVVNSQTAARCTAVYACVSLIAQSIATLPLLVYERREGGRRVADNHHLYPILHDEPNPTMSSSVFREVLVTHLLLSGNAYASILRTKGGKALELWPLDPRHVQPERRAGRLCYTVQTQNADGQPVTEVLDQDNVLHIPGLGFDGVTGMSPIENARQAIGLALAAEQYGASLFGRGARPSGVLKHPQKLSEEAAKKLKASWEAAHAGPGQAGRTAVLEEGMEWQPLSMTSTDAQFLETRKFQVEEIARIFRVPLHMISSTEKSTSWGSGIEQMSIGFVMYTLRPWMVRLEQEINRKLFSRSERGKFYAEHKVDGLLRGDAKTRAEYYASAIQNAWMTPNEVRSKENLPWMEGGDVLLIQQNMTPTTQLGGTNDAQA